MNLSNYYWYFQSVLSPKFCDELINYGNSHKEKPGLTGLSSKNNGKLTNEIKNYRDSNIVWLTDSWIYKEISPYINKANKEANWNFQLDLSESFQFTKYKLNQYYDWHADSWDHPYDSSKGVLSGKIRKLSVTCSLSSPEDYQGGELEFDFRNNEADKDKNIRTCTEILPRGSLVVFPSFVWHRVKPVTRGTRYSLVIWTVGDPYK
jgi:PKHD-type hydroxylase